MKINAEYNQKQNGAMEAQGYAMTITGEVSGKDVIYFAYKKGLYIFREGTFKGKGNIDAAGMGIPFEMALSLKVDLK